METVQRISEQAFVSELLSVRQFLETASEAVAGSSYDAAAPAEHVAAQMGCSLDILGELRQICDPETLRSTDDPADDLFLGDQIPDAPLKDELDKRRRSAPYKQAATLNQKFYRWNFRVLDSFVDAASAPRCDYAPADVMLTVVLMKAHNRQLEHFELRLGRLLKPDAAYLVPGRLPLSRLRDRIQCPSDYAFDADLSHDVGAVDSSHFSRQFYPSNYLFIHDTFYNDRRRDDSLDLSDEVMAWAKRRSRELGPFNKADMAGTTFLDLRLRLGQPYLYLHQGSCEHLLVVTDLRLMGANDCQSYDEYPISVMSKVRSRAACAACKVYTARWVTYGNERLPTNPAFFCDDCFKKFNYDDNGQKIGAFEAVPYFDRTALC